MYKIILTFITPTICRVNVTNYVVVSILYTKCSIERNSLFIVLKAEVFCRELDSVMQVVVSDMTAFWCNDVYYELTLYLDMFNLEIVAYGLFTKKGNRETYFDGLKELIEKKKEYQNLKLILHTDQGSVYSSKSYNELLPLYNIVHSMSRAGTPTDNGTMESINGWLKEELFNDFHLKQSDDVEATIKEYIHFFNYERPSFSLNYLTPIQFKERYSK